MDNSLYLVVLPLIHIGSGLVEQTLTLLPDRNFATEFFPDEVDLYVATFQNRIKHLVGGHVTGYRVTKQPTSGGRVIVKVEQNIA